VLKTNNRSSTASNIPDRTRNKLHFDQSCAAKKCVLPQFLLAPLNP